jgi:CheY-like chemotaxis protein
MKTRSGNKVLVIEDNPLNLELVTDLLEASGYAVWQARTAEEGIHLAQTTLPDVILMDLSLPGMDGLAATKALRANPATCHLPVIALTAHAMKGDEENALNAGCDGYLAKPIDTRTFVARLLGFIEAANSRRTRTQQPVIDYGN